MIVDTEHQGSGKFGILLDNSAFEVPEDSAVLAVLLGALSFAGGRSGVVYPVTVTVEMNGHRASGAVTTPHVALPARPRAGSGWKETRSTAPLTYPLRAVATFDKGKFRVVSSVDETPEGESQHLSISRFTGTKATDESVKEILAAFGVPDADEPPTPGGLTLRARHFYRPANPEGLPFQRATPEPNHPAEGARGALQLEITEGVRAEPSEAQGGLGFYEAALCALEAAAGLQVVPGFGTPCAVTVRSKDDRVLTGVWTGVVSSAAIVMPDPKESP